MGARIEMCNSSLKIRPLLKLLNFFADWAFDYNFSVLASIGC